MKTDSLRLSCKGSLREGSILVLVMWMIIILSILALSVNVLSSSQVHSVRQYRNKMQGYFVARAGIATGFAELDRDTTRSPGLDALKSDWSNKAEVFANRNLGDYGSWSDTYDYSSGVQEANIITTTPQAGAGVAQYNIITSGSVAGTAAQTAGGVGGVQVISNTFYGLIDEERRININSMNRLMPQVLVNLFVNLCGLQTDQAQALSDCILDWRSPSNVKRPLGAKNEYYQSLPNPYSCKNGRFDVPEELLLVKGMKPAYFAAIKDFITVHSDGRININTAPYPVLCALGLPASLAEGIIRCRAGTDEVEGTDDDVVFPSPQSVPSILASRQSLNPTESQQLGIIINSGILSVTSSNFRIISTGYPPNSDLTDKNTTQITCIINRTSGKIIYWQE